MKRLYIFDMDGTLIPGSTASLEIAKVTDTTHLLAEMEEALSNQAMTGLDFAQRIHELWGTPDAEIVKKAFQQCPKLRNIEKTLSHIKESGHVSCMMTLSPDYFAHRFFSYGFDYIFASTLPDKVLNGQKKVSLAKELCVELDISFSQSAVFGDSSTDVPLMQELPQSVAVNGKGQIHEHCAHAYAGEDLWEAFSLLNG